MKKLKEVILGIVNHTAGNEILNANANKAAERLPVQRDLVAGEVARHLALEELLPRELAEAHKSGDVYQHDLDYAPLFGMTNCCLIDLKGMLATGFTMGNAEIESPKGITTACAITAQIIANVASHQYGGTSVNRIDEVLAPYVRKTYNKFYSKHLRRLMDDHKPEEKAGIWALQDVEKETYDAFQALEYECNSLFTSNGY